MDLASYAGVTNCIEHNGHRYWREDLVVLKSTDTGDFSAFWKAYPARNGKKLCKAQAETQYRKAVKEVPPDILLAAVNAYARHCGDFAVDAFRWLRNKRWQDYLDEPPPDEVRSRADDMLAEWINGNAYIPPTAITSARAHYLVSAGKVTPERARERGLI